MELELRDDRERERVRRDRCRELMSLWVLGWGLGFLGNLRASGFQLGVLGLSGLGLGDLRVKRFGVGDSIRHLGSGIKD